MHLSSLRLRALTLALALGALPALAQSSGSGAIAGTLTDSAGALIPNATIVITDTDTGAVRTITSNSAGSFNAPFLQPGHYTVLAGGGSFARVERKNIIVTVGDTIAVNTVLPAASVSTEVIVTTEAPVLDTAKISVSQVIDQQIIAQLPVNGRRYDNFVLLTPNVVPDGSSGILSFRGISGLYNQNIVDGTNNNQAFFSEARGRAIGAPYVYSTDSIKEFAAAASGYSAEFGGAAGGIINAITRSGTNDLHADLFYSLRYPDLNAIDPYSKWSALHNNGNPTLLTQTVHQQQQFGGSIGGPIIKDKLFGFFTYDGFRRVNPVLYTSTNNGVLTGYAAGTTACPAGVTSAQCIAAANFLLSQLGSFPRTIKQDIFFPKLDYQINQKNHISAQFLFDNFKQPNGNNSSATISNGGVSQNGTLNYHERIAIVNLESQITANSANELHTQWSRDLETTSTNSPGPAYSLSNLAAFGETSSLPRPKFPDEHRWQAFDVYTFSHGKHTPKFGVDLNFIHEQLQNLFQGDGAFSYTNGSAAVNFSNFVQDIYGLNGANHYSNFTQVRDAINTSAPGLDDFWNKNLGVFLEDSWKVTPRLLVNAGVRYDVQLVPQPQHPYVTSPFGGTPSPLGAYYTSTININYKMVQPRVGFSFSLDPKTVIRGGYGMFYGLNSNSLYYTTRVENGVYQQQFNYTPANAPAGFTANNVLFTPPGPPLAAAFTGAVTPSVFGGGGANFLSPVSYRGIDPHFTNPYTHSFDLAVEHQLPFGATLSVGYVGTRGMRLPYDIDVNQPHATTTRTYTILNAAGAVDTTQGANGKVTVPFTPVGTLRPSVNDGNVLVGFSGINSWYHSGAFSLKKPFSHGLELLVNYTWAKALDSSQVQGGNSIQNGGGGTFQGTNVILDPFNLKGQYGNGINLTKEYGRSDLDIRGRFVGSFVYSPVLHADLPHYALYAINGWTLSGSYTAQSGTPLVALLSGTLPATAAGLNGGATGLAVNLNNSGSTAGRVPFLPRNSSVFAGVHNMDLRAGREFPIHDKVSFSTYAEVFNLANHKEVIAAQGNAYSYVTTGGGGACTAALPCMAPYVNAVPFGTPTTTSGTLYGARQLQFIAKLNF